MYKGQHLVFGTDEFRLGGAAIQKGRINVGKGGKTSFPAGLYLGLSPKFLMCASLSRNPNNEVREEFCT